ncbi:MAG: transcription antitermination factor NusB, partial [Candidatus Cloacimonadota bacterium]
MGGRRKAREMVLNGLYYHEMTGIDSTSLLQHVANKKVMDKEIKEYATRLLEETMKNLIVIDKKLTKIIKNWDLDRVAVIDKCILRLATAELLFFPDIPVKVSIDEAVEIAKKYSTENSGGFVNGILDEIAREENL